MGFLLLQSVIVFWLGIKIAQKQIHSMHPKWGLYAVLITVPMSLIVNGILDSLGFWIPEIDDFSSEAYILDVISNILTAVVAIGVFVLIIRLKRSKRQEVKTETKLGGFFVFLQVIWIIEGIAFFIHEFSMDLQGMFDESHITFDRNIGLFSWMLGIGYILYLKKRSRLKTVEEIIENDHRPPVLFLRSFETENKRVKIPFKNFFSSTFRNFIGYTFDEYLEKDVTKMLGPFIALGRPGDYLPMPGAARSYVHDENWQETITGYCEKASVIIFLESMTEGDKWELEHIRNRIDYRKLIVVTFPNKFNYSRKSWLHFHDILNKTAISVPLKDPGPGVVLAFNERWESSVLLKNAKKPREIVLSIWNYLQ